MNVRKEVERDENFIIFLAVMLRRIAAEQKGDR